MMYKPRIWLRDTSQGPNKSIYYLTRFIQVAPNRGLQVSLSELYPRYAGCLKDAQPYLIPRNWFLGKGRNKTSLLLNSRIIFEQSSSKMGWGPGASDFKGKGNGHLKSVAEQFFLEIRPQPMGFHVHHSMQAFSQNTLSYQVPGMQCHQSFQILMPQPGR